ncbi:MAG: hypothetical protein GY835_09535, partial [bacterium]|nr:hypothetical protein [bacterium]
MLADLNTQRFGGGDRPGVVMIDEADKMVEADDGSEKIPREELKLSIVDVRCIDEQGTQYIVEMQLFNVAGFEERIIYNASKAFTLQLKTAEDYNKLKGVVGVTICD